MFVLDTNVISEIFSPRPSAHVTAWMDAHNRESYWVTAIRRAELLLAERRRIGRPIGEFDAQIASIARGNGFALVTRNVRDFEHCGVEIINP